MLWVEIVDQFLHIPEILCRFRAGLYVTVTRPWYEIMQSLVASVIVEDPVSFPFVRVIDNSRLQFTQQLAS